MPYSEFKCIHIIGIASAVPAPIVSKNIKGNSPYQAFSNLRCSLVSDKRKYVSELWQTSSDLGFVAANRLLGYKQIARNSIGILIFVSQTPDYRSPATACVLQHRLGLSNDCIVFDVNISGAGFVYGMNALCPLLEHSNGRYGILVIGDTISKQLDPVTKEYQLRMSDGASAVLFERNPESEMIRLQTWADGSGFDSMIIPAGAFRLQHVTEGTTVVFNEGNKNPHYLLIDDARYSSFVLSEIPHSYHNYIEKNGIDPSDFDYYVFSLYSVSLMEKLADKMDIPTDKVLVNMSDTGYFGAGSIPMLLSELLGEVEKRDMRLFACAFGEGFSWGMADFTINTDDVLTPEETKDYYTEGRVSHEI